jgi:AI-2 transport protein TqsA
MTPSRSSSTDGPVCESLPPGETDHRMTADPGGAEAQAPDQQRGGFPGIAMSLLGIVAAGAIMKAGSSFLIPITVAFFLMLLLQPVSRWTARRFDTILCRLNAKAGRDHRSRVLKLSDYFSVILVILLFLFLSGVLYLMVSGQISLIMSKSSQIEGNITKPIEGWITSSGIFGDSASVDMHIGTLTGTALSLVPSAAVPIISGVFTFIMILFITAFLLIGRRTLEERLRNVRDIKRIEYVVERIESSTRGFIQAKIICSLLTGLGVYIMLDVLYLGFQDAVIWGLVYLVLNFIPFYGSLVAGLGTTLYTMSVHDPGKFLGAWPVIPLLILINVLVSNGIEPKLMQRRLPIGPVTVLFVVILWAWLWGAWGMILALPMSIMFRLLLVEIKGKDYWLCILMEA